MVYNDVRGSVPAYITGATVTAATGTSSLTALEQAMIEAKATSDVTSSGGNSFGGGTSLAANGQIVTNLVLSAADAYIHDSYGDHRRAAA